MQPKTFDFDVDERLGCGCVPIVSKIPELVTIVERGMCR